MGQYSMQAGEPAQPVQQSVVIASIRGRFLRAALPSPSDMGQCFSTMSYIRFAFPARFAKSAGHNKKSPAAKHIYYRDDSNIALVISSTICVVVALCLPPLV